MSILKHSPPIQFVWAALVSVLAVGGLIICLDTVWRQGQIVAKEDEILTVNELRDSKMIDVVHRTKVHIAAQDPNRLPQWMLGVVIVIAASAGLVAFRQHLMTIRRLELSRPFDYEIAAVQTTANPVAKRA